MDDSSIINILTEEFQCHICFDLLEDPRSPCSWGHTFCKKCLEQLVQQNTRDNRQISCPICRGRFGPTAIDNPVVAGIETAQRFSRILGWLRLRVAKPLTRDIGQQTSHDSTRSTGQQTDDNSTRSVGQQTSHNSTRSTGQQTDDNSTRSVGQQTSHNSTRSTGQQTGAASVRDQGQQTEQSKDPSYVDYLITVAVWVDRAVMFLRVLVVVFCLADYLDPSISMVPNEIEEYVRGFSHLGLGIRSLLLGLMVAASTILGRRGWTTRPRVEESSEESSEESIEESIEESLINPFWIGSLGTDRNNPIDLTMAFLGEDPNNPIDFTIYDME